MNKKPLEQIKNVTNVTGYRQVSLWKREDLQHPQPDELAEEVPVALVYNGISHVVMMASPKEHSPIYKQTSIRTQKITYSQQRLIISYDCV